MKTIMFIKFFYSYLITSVSTESEVIQTNFYSKDRDEEVKI
jgi:hypothetical protein